MNKQPLLEVKDIHIEVEGIEVVKGVSLELKAGEKHVMMGPNGSGKSSLANALAGHPSYTITSGEVKIDGKDLLEMDATERSLAGLFLAFQYPFAIPGVTVSAFIRSMVKAHRGDSDDVLRSYRKEMEGHFKNLDMKKTFATRYVNDGFSGGEKKRFEILQMLMLKPRIGILDEIDSGLDIDALRTVSDGVNLASNESNALLLVTHYQRILDYIKPDFVHVMMDGRLVRSGDLSLVEDIESRGYEWLKEEHLQEAEVA